MKRMHLSVLAFVAAMGVLAHRAQAYIEAPYSMGRLIQEATSIALVQCEKTDNERNLIIYKKVQDVKGKAPDVIKHNIAKAGFHPREWQTIMNTVQPGKMALVFSNNAASETCIDLYWYQCYPGGEWWNMNHAEPYLLRSFAGKPDKLAGTVAQMLTGTEVILPCMADGDKNALQLRTAKMQRMKASMAIQDYNQKRDFAGFGSEDFKRITNMPAFAQEGGLGRLGLGIGGILAADVNHDNQCELLAFSEQKTVFLQNGGTAFEDVPLPYTGGARAAAFGDYNGDGKLDLLLATPIGLKLFTNVDTKYRDDSAALPKESYYNLRAVAWLDTDNTGRQDILLSNGFLGLRLYRYRPPATQPAATGAKFGKWYYAGPFDNPGGAGFDKAYPPEMAIDLNAQFIGKNNEKFGWKEGNFADAQVNSLLLFKPELCDNACIYVYRDIECAAAMELPISLGSDDTLTVWVNGQKILAEKVDRGCQPDQNQVVAKLRAGKNQLLLKICNGGGDWGYYFAAQQPVRPVPQMFEDVSTQLGLGLDGIGGDVKGDHIAVADVNNDGRPDFLYSAGTGLLVLNTPQGFVVSKDSGITYQAGRVAPVFGKFMGDGLVHLCVPQVNGVKIFRNDGRGRFADVTAQTGDLAKFTGHATCAVFADFNKTGQLDLLVGCLRGPNQYFKNNGNGTFTEATESLGLQQRIFNSRGIAVADFNRDGVPDLAMANEGQESAALLSAGTRIGGPSKR